MPRRTGRVTAIIHHLLADTEERGLSVSFESKSKARSAQTAFYAARSRLKRAKGFDDPTVLKLYSYTITITKRVSGWSLDFEPAAIKNNMFITPLDEAAPTVKQGPLEETKRKAKLERKQNVHSWRESQ